MLELQNISYKKNNKIILKNINLKLHKNEVTVITGPNGSGKSTLAKIIMGLEKPTTGKIIFNGKDITTMPLNKRANLGISYAFQNPISFTGLTIKELFNIVRKDTTFEVIKEYLSKVGLCAKEYINRNFDDSLSGGEKKRIEIAIILYKNGELNIFDEPEAGIDLWSFDKLIKIFNIKNTNKINLIISHQEKILKIANKILILKDGEIIEDTTDPNIIKTYTNPCIKCKEL